MKDLMKLLKTVLATNMEKLKKKADKYDYEDYEGPSDEFGFPEFKGRKG